MWRIVKQTRVQSTSQPIVAPGQALRHSVSTLLLALHPPSSVSLTLSGSITTITVQTLSSLSLYCTIVPSLPVSFYCVSVGCVFREYGNRSLLQWTVYKWMVMITHLMYAVCAAKLSIHYILNHHYTRLEHKQYSCLLNQVMVPEQGDKQWKKKTV